MPPLVFWGDYNGIWKIGEQPTPLHPVQLVTESLPAEQAVSEVGLFGNQNSVAQPRTPKWAHTVDRRKASWKVE